MDLAGGRLRLAADSLDAAPLKRRAWISHSDALQSHGVNAVAKAPKGGLLAPKAAVSNKVRERVPAAESARLAAVAAPGAFPSDPLGTLRAHIEALLPDKGKDKKAGKQNARPPNKNGSAKRKVRTHFIAHSSCGFVPL